MGKLQECFEAGIKPDAKHFTLRWRRLPRPQSVLRLQAHLSFAEELMALSLIASVKPDEADVRACLERMLASPIFAQAERQKRFLRYLVQQTLAGRAEQIKGYTIAVEVFDRPCDFDPAIDAIVRVQAGQLRAKLREYYEGDGRTDPLRFELPKGGYAMRVTWRDEPAQRESAEPPEAPHTPRFALPLISKSPLTRLSRSGERHKGRSRNRSRSSTSRRSSCCHSST